MNGSAAVGAGASAPAATPAANTRTPRCEFLRKEIPFSRWHLNEIDDQRPFEKGEIVCYRAPYRSHPGEQSFEIPNLLRYDEPIKQDGRTVRHKVSFFGIGGKTRVYRNVHPYEIGKYSSRNQRVADIVFKAQTNRFPTNIEEHVKSFLPKHTILPMKNTLSSEGVKRRSNEYTQKVKNYYSRQTAPRRKRKQRQTRKKMG